MFEYKRILDQLVVNVFFFIVLYIFYINKYIFFKMLLSRGYYGD